MDCILVVIVKQFMDARLKDLFVEFSMLGQASSKKVSPGKHLIFAMKMHICVFETMLRFRWEPSFLIWLIQKGHAFLKNRLTTSKKLRDLIKETNPNNLEH